MSSHCALVATWLLDRTCDEGLVGDLVEQYDKSRSLTWYLRQSMVAMVVSCGRTLFSHKWLAARAIFTGWIVWFASTVAFGQALLPNSVAPLFAPAGPTSWPAWLPYGGVALAMKAFGWFANGWIIGRLHRPHQTAMVMAYVLFSLVMCVPTLITLLAETIGHPRYYPTPFGMLVAVVSLLLGGMLSAAPSVSRNPHEAIPAR